MSFFVMLILVENQQTYNSIFEVNWVIAVTLALTTIWLSGLFLVSFSPRPAFLGRLGRFFTSCRRLTESLRGVGEGRGSSFALAFHILAARHQPAKIRPWIARQPAVAAGSVDGDGLYALADGLEMLSVATWSTTGASIRPPSSGMSCAMMSRDGSSRYRRSSASSQRTRSWLMRRPSATGST